MTTKFGIIYGHHCIITDKWYIGQTINSKAKYRWGKDGSGYLKRNPDSHFARAIKKYGWENFEHIIFESNIPIEDLDKKEQEYIQRYNSVENGYNSTYGGGANHEVSAETKQKNSIKSKEMWQTQGDRLRAIYSSPEHRKVLSESVSKAYDDNPELRKKASANARLFMWVCNKNEVLRIYKTAFETYKALGYQQGITFIDEVQGQSIIHNYVENDYSITELELKYKIDRKVITRYLIDNNIEVINKHYRTSAKTKGVPKSDTFKKAISKSMKQYRKGRVWVHKDNEKSKSILADELENYLANGWTRGRGKIDSTNIHHNEKKKKFICVETGHEYFGVRATARLLGIAASTLLAALKDSTRLADNKHWKYI
jgi:group I intron endonuclease